LKALVFALVLPGLTFVCAMLVPGCANDSPPVLDGGARPAEITYLCRETGETLKAPRQQTPAVNPQTGRKTLVQALYCTSCQAWHAAPPPAMAERLPLGPVCPVHRTPLMEFRPEEPLSANKVR
jgi:hypothetical protein